jgi:uncharacterized protein (TIGR00730 family)
VINVCVFCGARTGNLPQFEFAARKLGQEIAGRGWSLVYGGAKIGMMGAVADAVMDSGGHVKGVIPEVLDWPDARWDRVTDMEVVPDLTIRKARMMEVSDAFVALPGGVGTLDEILELAAAKQLKMGHAADKPMLVLNVAGYFNPIQEIIGNAVRREFLRPEDAGNVRFFRDVPSLMGELDRALGSRRR